MTPTEQIALNFRALREAQGMSQAQVSDAMKAAGLTNIHPQTVTRIEHGSRSVRLSEAPAFAHVLGGTVQDLISGIEVETRALQQLARIRELTREVEDMRRTLAIGLGRDTP